jgi:hypothetical protein
MSPPLFTTTNPDELEDQVNRNQTRRARPLSMATKLAKDTAALQDSLRLSEHQASEDDARVLKLMRVAFGDKLEKTLKSHPSITDEDRQFLRERKGWRV